MYTQKDYTHLLGTAGFSDTMLTNHFTLYGGYVTNTNKLLDLIKSKEAGTPEFAELRRRYGWEYCGMKMHEFYFENMTKDTVEISENLKDIINKDFESVENFKKELAAIGMMRGIGWVVWSKDETEKSHLNWVGEHEVGQLVNTKTLLVMDCWEHSYMTDYGIKRADYIASFINAINWKVVEERLA